MAAAIGAYVLIEVAAYRAAYPNGVDPLQYAMFQDNPVVRMMQGVPSALDVAGGYMAWDGGWIMQIILAVWALLTMTRLLRGDEDAERGDLVLAGRIRPTVHTAAVLGTVYAEAVVVGAVAAVALVLSGRGRARLGPVRRRAGRGDGDVRRRGRGDQPAGRGPPPSRRARRRGARRRLPAAHVRQQHRPAAVGPLADPAGMGRRAGPLRHPRSPCPAAAARRAGRPHRARRTAARPPRPGRSPAGHRRRPGPPAAGCSAARWRSPGGATSRSWSPGPPVSSPSAWSWARSSGRWSNGWPQTRTTSGSSNRWASTRP